MALDSHFHVHLLIFPISDCFVLMGPFIDRLCKSLPYLLSLKLLSIHISGPYFEWASHVIASLSHITPQFHMSY